jgi:hypothetical protein
LTGRGVSGDVVDVVMEREPRFTDTRVIHVIRTGRIANLLEDVRFEEVFAHRVPSPTRVGETLAGCGITVGYQSHREVLPE